MPIIAHHLSRMGVEYLPHMWPDSFLLPQVSFFNAMHYVVTRVKRERVLCMVVVTAIFLIVQQKHLMKEGFVFTHSLRSRAS